MATIGPAQAPSPVFGRRCVLAAAVLWSLSGVITKWLPLDSLTIAFYRGLFAGLVFLPFVPRRHWQFRWGLVPLGLIFGAMTGAYLGSVKLTTAANAIYLQYTSTFWTVPLSAWLLGERPDRRALAGIALATIGIAAIVGYGYGSPGRPHEWEGILLGLASGLGYAGVTVAMRGLRGLDPLWLSAAGNLTGAFVLGAWITGVRGGIHVPSPTHTAILIAFGAVQMAIPYALFARGLRDIGAPEAGLIALLEPVLNPIWVVLVIHEWPTRATLVGGAFLLAGVACRYWPARPGMVTEASARE
ncbi:MAG: EamA family transporter [Isosphaeraceae bacterium]|nr:EamA family transporter [Isosphaeraceae bacterium]